MRLKIKYTATKKFVLNFNGRTVGELVDSVKAFVADTYGETCPEFALSLNGQEPLAGSAETPLTDLGIVASDMLTVLPGVALAAGGASSTTGTSGGEAGGSGQPPQPPVEGAMGDAAVAAASLPAVFAPSTLLDVSDVTTKQDGGAARTLPASLVSLLAHCRPKDASQLVNLLAHITMLECDFKAPNSTGGGSSQACSCPSPSCTGPCKTPAPSPGWDGPVASLNYDHKSFSSFTCTLVLVSMGHMKQMLVSFPGQDVEISTKVDVRDYVSDDKISSPIEGSSLRHVSRLAKHLRNELLVPLQLAAHRVLDVPSPRHLAGLPPELLFLVLKRSDARSVLQLSCCCKRLQSAATDDAVWMQLYKTDFPDAPIPSLAGERTSDGNLGNWLARYKVRYLERKARKVDQQDPWNRGPYSPSIYPSPLPRIYPIGPLYPGFPNHPHGPQPVGPYPVIPDPTPPFNPIWDPDSPYYGGEVPNGPAPPNPLGPYPPRNPLGPLHGGDPMNPFGEPMNPFGEPMNPFGDPMNPFGDPSFGGLGPGLPGRRNPPRGGPRGGPGGFRFI